MSAPTFQHEIESKPLRAEHGRLKLNGWCLAPGQPRVPSVRLRIGEQVHSPARRIPRRDVIQSLGADANAEQCGFVIEAEMKPGAHWAQLEASIDNAAWQPVKRFTILATPGRLHAVIEQPQPPDHIETSVRVQGWCAHPNYSLQEVWLHYGTKRVRCTGGLPRTDVPRLLPGAPDAARAGFIAGKNLPVGRGPLRVKGLGAAGETWFATPGTFMNITRDEDHPQPLQLDGPRADLGPARRAGEVAPPVAGGPGYRILFVLYGDFTSNSAIHVGNLANELIALGHACTVAVPRNPETAAYFRSARFAVRDYAAVLADPAVAFDVVHAWTTRENVRAFCGELRTRQPGFSLCVHLEDNEQRILELNLGFTSAELAALPAARLDALVPPTLSHPRRSREFLAQADGVTVILDALRAHVPPGKPLHTVWPAAETGSFFFRPRPVEFRRALGWADEHIVLVYHGNVHATNRAEVAELYAAVLELNRRGQPCTLLRLGRDFCDYLGDMAAAVAPHVLELGLIEQHHHLPVLLSLADYFVQPGEPDPFNDFRFPSKLPEFFALGRPVILPRTNVGLQVQHAKEAWVLDRADRAGIVEAILELQRQPALRARLAEGALAFAQEHFNWAHSAQALSDFYRRVVPAR